MDLGIPTLVEMTTIEEAAQLASALGFSFVELNMNLPWCTLEKLHQADLKSLQREYGIYFTLHADENLFFCDFSERISRAHTENMLDAIHLCKENGLPLINFHMSRGVYFTLPDKKVYLFSVYRDEYMKKIQQFKKACEQAAGNTVKLCIENTGIKESFVWEGVDALLSSNAFQLTWDLGHDYSANCCDKPNLMMRKERVIHMHLHDALGKECHLPMGKGKLDAVACINSVHSERIVLEVKTIAGIRESLPWLNQHLAKHFNKQ
ncbi:MAG: sugar phosphate isomerase/epimerase [Clostridia bacterium]|nr:sugar phosphate isomerase/epimerase [Clostridia bacterium]